MPDSAVQTRFYRFGDYELDSTRRLLLRNGQRVALTPKAFDVLLVLVGRSGEIVNKGELFRAVWPDTEVEEISLTRNISVLRKTLGEKPDEHNYIVTVPGTGYRFVAAVERADSPATAARQPAAARSLWTIASVMALSAVAGLSAWYFWPRSTPPLWRGIPLTSYPGHERNPALSPEGNQVAFAWNGEKQDNFDIYVKAIGPDAPRRLTTDLAEDGSPAWSSDGRTIAFLRRLGADRTELMLIPAFGGVERKLAETRGELRPEFPSLAWSSDGRWLVVSHREPADLANGLFLVSAQTGDKRRLTAAPRGFIGDYMPAFSPDRRSLAFARLSGWVVGEIYRLPVSGDFSAAAEPQRLTTDGRLATSPVWTRDGRHIAYVFAEANHEAPREFRMISVSGSRSAERMPLLEDDVSELSLGRHLVYSRQVGDPDIWRAELGPPGRPRGEPQRLISSTRHDGLARYSPDGKKIAFGSTRSGPREIWIAEADGSNPVKLTSFGGPQVGVKAWSPDSQKLVFSVGLEGQSDLFTIPATGGPPKRLTTDPSDEKTPSYSHDGRWIYFSSIRSGRWEIWKMPAEGGEAAQVTHSEGSYMPMESPDGKTLYYCHKIPE
jgi:Tol biopolymer transport system component/DNA-binding winged helix-turn-helix (wHTH) protein